MNIVSLVPSATETLISWGRAPVACTRFCEQPDIPHVGGTKDPDIDRIVELDPHLVVVDEEENRREDHDSLIERGVPVHVLRIRSLEDVNPAMMELSHQVGADCQAFALPEPAPARLTAFVPIWRRPWMALGMPTYGASLLAHLGVSSIFGRRRPVSDPGARRGDRPASRCGPGTERTVPVHPAATPRALVGGTHRLCRREGPVLVGSPHPGGGRPAVQGARRL